MAEESCEEMDWSEARPLAARRPDGGEEEAARRREEVPENEKEESSSSNVNEKKTYSESLSVEARIRESKGTEEAVSLPVESRVREDTKMEETLSESLSGQARTRGTMSRIEEWSESPPAESRIRCDAEEENVFSESLPVEARSPDRVDCDMTYGESLPVQSRVRGEGCAGKGCTNGLSDESMKSSDESLKNESLSAEKEDAAEKSQTSGRLTRHRTSWSLPSEAVKYDFKTSFISKTDGSPSNNGQVSNVVTRVSWSLPNEARVQETKGSPDSVSKEPRKGDTGSSATIRVSSLPNETRSRESKGMRAGGSLTNETQVKEEGSESLPHEARLRQLEDETARKSNSSLPSETRRRNTDESETGLCLSLPNGSRARGKTNQYQTKTSLSSSKKHGGSLSEDSKEKVGKHVWDATENAKEEGKVEVIDRTDDKKYNFSALRMKRKQVQLAAKNRKEGATKSVSSRQPKKSTDLLKTSTLSVPGSIEENCDGGGSRVAPVPAQKDEMCDSAKVSASATMKSSGSEKSGDLLSTVPTRSKTPQKIIEDLESDTSWRTTRSTDFKEDNNTDERSGERNPMFTMCLADRLSIGGIN